MTVIGSIEVVADRDVKAGDKTTIPSLFSISERSREYSLEENVIEGRKVKVDINKLQSFESTADATLPKGEDVSCWRIIQYADFNFKELVASEDITKGDKLSVTFETE